MRLSAGETHLAFMSSLTMEEEEDDDYSRPRRERLRLFHIGDELLEWERDFGFGQDGGVARLRIKRGYVLMQGFAEMEDEEVGVKKAQDQDWHILGEIFFLAVPTLVNNL